ncbi:putative SprT family Zn-dependent metalloprotease [Clostridiales Family XIII bacterium PM5-7]
MDRLQRLYQSSLQEVQRLGIKPSRRIHGVIVNTRAKRRLGCCKRNRVHGIEGFQIEISANVMDCDEQQIKEVLIHEILHTCRGCFDHGKKWKLYAEMVSDAYGYHISRTKDAPEVQPDYQYEIRCKQCGSVFYRVRRSKVVVSPEDYRCGKCKGQLEVSAYHKKEAPSDTRLT